MDMIIFGAGASFGSDTSNTPPLGDKLLNSLIQFSPNACGKLTEEQKGLFSSDFEQGMQQLSDSNPYMMPPLQRAMAAYFFHFVPYENNLYRKLSYKIKQSGRKVALATFNYERLLELSLIQGGLQPVVGSEPNASNKIELCLPHGCCHLFCDVARGDSNAVSFNPFIVKTNCAEPSVISNPEEFYNRITDAFTPIMSYFEPQKRTSSGENVITAQRDRYKELVLGASKIAIIGLKLRPHDVHIWNPLDETQATIIYCSGKEAGDEFQNWANQNRSDRCNIILKGYFEQHFSDICNELGI